MSGGDSGPERIEVDLGPGLPPGPTVPVQLRGVGTDDVNHAETPSDLVAGPDEAGVETEWDAGTLDSAITWLETHAYYLERLAVQMADIQDLMGGPTAAVPGAASMPGGAGVSPLGSFPWAVRLAEKHAGLYTSTEAGVGNLARNLRNAVAVLGQVKENYETAEGANEMSAAEMNRVFTGVAGDGGFS